MFMRRRLGPLRVTQPLFRTARGPRFPKGPAVGGAEYCMRRRVAPAAHARPVVPVEPTPGGAVSRSAVQLRRGPRGQRAELGPAAGGASRSMRLGAGLAESSVV
jgi:hypothetical protein